MLRVHFTAEDLARTTVAAEPDLLWEVLLSLHQAQGRDGQVVFGSWRRHAFGTRSAELSLLRELAPPTGYSPDFLTPPGAGADLDAALERLLSTPGATVRADVGRLASRTVATPWMRELGAGSAGAMRRLAGAVRSYHEKALRPFWPSIRQHVVADRSRRMQQWTRHGLVGVLSGLHPRIRWRAPVLEVLDFADIDLHLDGRGVLLQPSFFCWHAPTKLYDTSLSPVLVYPTAPSPGALHRSDRGGSLAALLGSTRAAALAAVVSGCTTSELARRCRVSPAAASHQAAVLRDAGLISTRRDGGAVRHEITELGLRLLEHSELRL